MSGEGSEMSIFSLCMWGVFWLVLVNGSISILMLLLIFIGIVNGVKEV